MRAVFVDLDNTLAANETCENIDFYKGLYYDKKPIKIVIDAINYLYANDNIFIISIYSGGEKGKSEKINWIKKYLPDNMKKNSPFLIDYKDSKTKADFIKNYALSNNIDLKECIIIDDKKRILQECNKEGIKTFYPQQIICKYEELI